MKTRSVFMKYLIFFFCFLLSSFCTNAQFFSLGHEHLIDPALVQKNKFQTLDKVNVLSSNFWDMKNFRSYTVAVFWGDEPAHEVLYQTDTWGNPTYLGVSSSIMAILESDEFPGFRFQSNCKKISNHEGKEKIKAFLSLLILYLNEVKQ